MLESYIQFTYYCWPHLLFYLAFTGIAGWLSGRVHSPQDNILTRYGIIEKNFHGNSLNKEYTVTTQPCTAPHGAARLWASSTCSTKMPMSVPFQCIFHLFILTTSSRLSFGPVLKLRTWPARPSKPTLRQAAARPGAARSIPPGLGIPKVISMLRLTLNWIGNYQANKCSYFYSL